MTPQRQKRLREQLRRSRARLLVRDAPIAMVLMYIRFVATKKVQRISTDGRVIYFDPDWLQKLSKTETDYILSHEVIHIVLEDYKRPAFFTGDRYHHACDIIACSVLRGRGWWDQDELPHIGRLPHRTYFPGHEGDELSPMEAYREVPFDPSAMPKSERRRFQIDSDEYWGGKLPPSDGTLILFPGFDGITEESVEEKQERFRLRVQYSQMGAPVFGGGQDGGEAVEESRDWELPQSNEDADDALDTAIDRLLNLIEAADACAPEKEKLLERIWNGIGEARLEWRRLLASFLQEEVNDYSFLPPDRRFADSGFFLPDFNQTEQSIRDVLFMVDSSGSIDDETIADVYGEICAAIEQFDGKLQGRLGFFDTQVATPEPFGSIGQLLKIRPKGNGGTDFGCIFRYVARCRDTTPSCLVIFTDGIGDFPPEEDALGIPVLWILYGDAPFPSWGKQARIKIKS